MKTLTQYIDEAFRINKDTKVNKHVYYPKTTWELKNLVKKLLDERGKDANLNDIDVSEITDMSDLFRYMSDIHNIDISEWNVSNVTDMGSMFFNCINFNCDISNWDVSNVKDMNSMFLGCKEFDSDLSKWDVSNVKYMGGIFYGCKNFNSDLSKVKYKSKLLSKVSLHFAKS